MTAQPLFSILLALSLCAPALAQTTDDEVVDTETQHYDVEIVIFKNLKVPRSREFVLPVSSPSRGERVFDLALAEVSAEAQEFDYRLLQPQQYRLVDVVGRLQESDRYEVLIHSAWRQPGLDLEQTLPVWIRGGRIFGPEFVSIDSRVRIQQQQQPWQDEQDDSGVLAIPVDIDAAPLRPPIAPGELYELEGKITVALARYLHTYVDLVLRRPRREAEIPRANAALDQALAGTDSWILNNHHLNEHRRMRSRNLHYIDHPEFSLLVLITPYDPTAVENTTIDSTAGVVLESDLTPVEAAETQDQ